jgi:hypothetical protein
MLKAEEGYGGGYSHIRTIKLRGEILVNWNEPGELAALTGVRQVIADSTMARRAHDLCGRSDVEVVPAYAWDLGKRV